MKNLFAKLKQPKVFRVLIGMGIVAATVAIVVFITLTANRVSIEDSLVAGSITIVSPTNPGQLQEIDVYEGQKIKRGDVIGIVSGQSYVSDIDGTVIMANNSIGSIVSSQSPLAEIVNDSQMRIAGTIDENKGLKDIKVGQVVSFTVDAMPGKTFWGYIDEVSPSAKQTQMSFSISSERPTQQFVVYAKYDSTKYPEIKNGMSAKMTVYTK